MNLLTRQHCKNGLIFILTTVVLHFHVVAQLEPMYSQYMFNMMNVNPAYAGSRGVPNLTALFRNQWSGMPGAPKTGNVSFDMPFATNNSAIGFQIPGRGFVTLDTFRVSDMDFATGVPTINFVDSSAKPVS